jgi:hypothetical protein
VAVFISFPAPLFGGKESTKKNKTMGVGEVAMAFCSAGSFGLLEGS